MEEKTHTEKSGVFNVVDVEQTEKIPVVVAVEATSNEIMIDLSDEVLKRFGDVLRHEVFKRITLTVNDVKARKTLNKKQREAFAYKGTPMCKDAMLYARTANIRRKDINGEAMVNAGLSIIEYIGRNQERVSMNANGTGFKQVLDSSKKARDAVMGIMAFDKLLRLKKAGIENMGATASTIGDTLALEDITSHRALEVFELMDAHDFVRYTEVNPSDLIRQGFTSMRLSQAEGHYDPITSIYQHGIKVHTYGPTKAHDDEVLGYAHLSINADTLGDLTVSAKSWACAKKNGGCGNLMGNGQVKKGGDSPNSCTVCSMPKYRLSGHANSISMPQIMSDGELKTYGGHQIHMRSCMIPVATARMIIGFQMGVYTAKEAIKALRSNGVMIRRNDSIKVPAKVVPVCFDVAYNGITFGLACQRINPNLIPEDE
jgi:hypothetical protein|tara:strand:- start:425 stop:1711 length:1287 start_codon:yes stop_codon:yes gene_type:complete